MRFLRRFLILAALLVAAPLVATPLAHAQESGVEDAEDTDALEPGPWKFTTIFGLNLSQSAYSSNWAGGDKGQINWVLQGDATAEKQVRHWFNWANLAQLAYGQTAKQVDDDEDANRIVFDVPEKTTDRILLESTGRFTLDSYLDPYAGLRIESQFSDQTDPDRHIGLNPVRFSQAAGVAHAFIKTDEQEFISRIGLGARQVFSRAFVDTFSTNTRSFTNVDGGVEWLTTVLQPFWDKSVVYRGRLLVFYPVFFSDSDDLKDFDAAAMASDPMRESVQDFWRAPDMNFQNTFTAQITKYLNVNLYIEWVYQKYDRSVDLNPQNPIEDQIKKVDAGIRKAGQFKQTLALGLTYQLF